MAASTKKYYVTVGGEYLVALETETGQLLGRNRDLNDLHAHVQSIFPGSVYISLDDERVQQYVAAQGTSRPPNVVAPSAPVSREQPDTDMMYCPNCGGANKRGVNFCLKCGNRFGPIPASPSTTQTYQAPLPVTIVQPPGQSGWFRRNLPHILAITGGLFFLLFMLLPLKAYSVDNFGSNGLGTVRLSQSGYGVLQTPGGLFIILAVGVAALKVVQMARGGVPSRREQNLTSYVTIACLAILGVLGMYWSVHLYDATTGNIATGYYEAPKGPYLTIPSLLIVLMGGIIEVRSYRRADAARAGAIQKTKPYSTVKGIDNEEPINTAGNAQSSVGMQATYHQSRSRTPAAKAKATPPKGESLSGTAEEISDKWYLPDSPETNREPHKATPRVNLQPAAPAASLRTPPAVLVSKPISRRKVVIGAGALAVAGATGGVFALSRGQGGAAATATTIPVATSVPIVVATAPIVAATPSALSVDPSTRYLMGDAALFDAPSFSGNLIARLKAGTEVRVTGEYSPDLRNSWVPVSVGDKSGYINNPTFLLGR